MLSVKKRFCFLFCLAFLNINAQENLAGYQKKINDYRYSKYLDSTKFYFKKALPFAVKKKDSVAIFYLYKHLGDGYEHHQKIDSTLWCYNICDRYIPYKNLALKSFLLNDKAYTYSLLHDYEKATQLTLESLKLAEKSGNTNLIAGAYMTLGEDYSKLKLNPQAEQYFLKAIKLLEKNKVEGYLHQAYRYYGIFLLENKRTNLAYTNLIKANKIAIKMKDSISMAYNWHYLADCYWNKKQKDSCFIVAKKAEGIWERRAENIDLSAVCLKQGKYYLALNNFKQSELYLKKAEKYILNDLYFNEELFTALANLYHKNGNSKQAFAYLMKAKSTVEKLKENENKSKMASLNIKFETDKKEALIKNEQEKNELTKLKLEKKQGQFLVAIGLLLFLLTTIGIIIFSYKKVQSKNKLLFDANQLLENLVNQKQTLLKEVHHRVKNNLTTLKSLLFLQAKSSDNQAVKSILKECQLRIQSMALIHQSLYEDAENDEVDFYLFIENLMESLESSYKLDDKNITVSIEKNQVILDISIAVFLGLVLNELATNSYKYAFANQNSGQINIKLEQKNNQLIVVYADNGCGLPNEFDEKSGGFGFKIIRILVSQIKGDLVYNYQNNLSSFTITISDLKK